MVIEEKRLQRGLAIWQAGQVSPNGAPGQYYVASQSRNIRYLVATPWAACGPKCGCEDYEKGSVCKHIVAAGMAEAHRRIAQRQANGETLSNIEFDVAAIGLAGVPQEVELGWEVYLRTVQAEQAIRAQNDRIRRDQDWQDYPKRPGNKGMGNWDD